MGRIVVGVDGSPESLAALRWAAQQARAHEATLQVVYSYGRPDELPPQAVHTALAIAPPSAASAAAGMRYTAQGGEEESEVRRRARDHAEVQLDSWLRQAEVAHLPITIERQLVPSDRPARTLIESSRAAEQLVVGSRGRGGVAGALLGSVSRQCVHHADCPTTVVRRGTA